MAEGEAYRDLIGGEGKRNEGGKKKWMEQGNVRESRNGSEKGLVNEVNGK